MKQQFRDSVRHALNLDLKEHAASLFSSPTGFILKVDDDKYAFVKGGHDLEMQSLADLLAKPPVEFYASGAELKNTISFVSGIGGGINPVGKLFKIDLDSSDPSANIKNLVEGKGIEALEIRTPDNKDISQLIAANVTRLRSDNKAKMSPQSPKNK